MPRTVGSPAHAERASLRSCVVAEKDSFAAVEHREITRLRRILGWALIIFIALVLPFLPALLLIPVFTHVAFVIYNRLRKTWLTAGEDSVLGWEQRVNFTLVPLLGLISAIGAARERCSTTRMSRSTELQRSLKKT